ncbi:MAG TPA: NAD-dependent epimerase/dehydratase family protein, partial [Vicinamibacterales bacterium]|nr:NAD-dependent epimerase/dehydratase family protein [Vicinamibacterales bacterium]
AKLVALCDADALVLGRRIAECEKEGIKVASIHDYRELLERQDIDAVVLATPPAHHAPATLDLVARGFHVFVEKPMATRLADARAMVEAADRAGVVLSVGLYRRFLPSVRLLKHLIDTRRYGAPLAVDIEEGGPYGWQLASLDGLTREGAGGGVLIDIGSHLLDELLFLVPGRASLDSYRDNSRGGIETDCLVHFDLDFAHGHLPVRMELSRTRELCNTIRIECEEATLELRRPDFTQVLVHRREASSSASAGRPVVQLSATWAGSGPFVGFQAFRDEIDDWVSAIADGGEPLLSGRSVLPVVKLIDECYARRTDLPEPWTDEGLAPATVAVPVRRRVLVTGAGGFLGGRTVEILRERYGFDVVALVHRPGSAARLARWPGEIVVGDVTSADDMARVVAGCDAVVHCAVGTTWPPEAARKVTVEGTRTVAEAARKAGVRRFVHVSSLFVHRRDGSGTLDETTPLEPPATDGYGQAKLTAERALAEIARQGLSTIVIRPTRIYGPFSKTFTIRPLQAIAAGTFAVTGGEVPANRVYVDNVVEGIARALEAPGKLSGSAYLVSDPEQLSLLRFYEYFAERAGRAVKLSPGVPGKSAAPSPGLVARWTGAGRAIATSPEFRGFVKRVLGTDPVGRIPRKLWDRSPRLQQQLLRRFGSDAAVVYRPQTRKASDDLVYYGEAALVSIRKAEAELGFAAAVAPGRARELTLLWGEYARLVRT